MKSFMKKYKIGLFFLFINLVIMLIDFEIGVDSFKTVGSSLKDLLTVTPPIFILLGLLDVWVEKETMIKFIGEDSGLKGIIISFLLGSVAAGPLYASFPVSKVFMGKGAKFSNVLVFTGAWSTAKIPLLIFEATSLGTRFAVIRLMLSIPVILITAYAIERLMSKDDIAEIYRA